MTAFIDEHRDVYGVEPICWVLPIAHPLTVSASHSGAIQSGFQFVPGAIKI
ncbi:MAG: hypothetical protein JWR80_3496 [Bradyrhizobium sp.]|nr:hypothetical protein [Bradyrhizobium sp.]